MTPQLKASLKKMLVTDLAILVIVLALGMILILPDCTFDCAERANLLGGGVANLIISVDILWGIWYWLKHRK